MRTQVAAEVCSLADALPALDLSQPVLGHTKWRDEVKIALALTLMLTPLTPLDPVLDPDAVFLRVAATRASIYSRRLLAPHLKYRVEIEESDEWIGSVVKNFASDGCVVRVRRAAVRRMDIIAHEVCHCVHDFPYLGTNSYDRRVTSAMIERMEREARTCEIGLVKGYSLGWRIRQSVWDEVYGKREVR
jgi:hypothetical protein